MARSHFARHAAQSDISFMGRLFQGIAQLVGVVEKIDSDLLMSDLSKDVTIQQWSQTAMSQVTPLVPLIQDNMPDWYHADVFKPKPVQTENLAPYNAVTCLAAGNIYTAEPVAADNYIQNVGRQLIWEEKILEASEQD